MEDSEKQNVSAAGRNNQGEAKSTQSQTVMSEYNGKVDPIEEIEAADMVNAADEFTEEQYRKVLRKVDWILLPLMWVSEDRGPRTPKRCLPEVLTSLSVL